MEQDVEANPTFRGTGTFRIVAADFFRRLPCSVRLVHVDRDGANFGFAFDALFGDGRQVDFMEFRNDTLENWLRHPSGQAGAWRVDRRRDSHSRAADPRD